MKKALISLLLMLPLAVGAFPGDSERIADLEHQVARLTEQVNILLAERKKAAAEDSGEVYVCRLSAFTRNYTAENSSRGRAKLDVLKQCRRDNHDMHCSESEIRCDSYR